MIPENSTTAQPHPSSGKVGVIISNLGTPDDTGYWSMRRYLNEFLSDQRVIDYPRWKWQPLLQLIILSKRPFSSGKAYRSVWNNDLNEGPLLTITRDQCTGLRNRLGAALGGQIEVDFCMRYGNPSTKDVIEGLKAKGCDRILFFPLYPQYAAATTATANDHAFRTLMEMNWQPAIRTVPAYFNDPMYIQALANSVKAAYAKLDSKPDILVTSYHGVPIRYITEGDPYHDHCQTTTHLLREKLGWQDSDISITFQSQFGPEEWLQPYTVEEVARLAKAGKKHLAIMAPAFSSDCLETLEEIKEEIKDSFIAAGGEKFTYIPCLNATSEHVDMIANIALRELQGWVKLL